MMKPSKYNVFFNYEGINIGFNGYSQEFIVIEPLLLELYDVGAKKNDFSELVDVHPEFHAFLVQQGFLVDSDIDEFERVKNLSQAIDNDDSNFELIINPTMNCNFKCWYCYETHIKDSKMDASTIEATISLAKNVVKNQKGLKNFSLSFFGGEPLLYFEKVITPILKSVATLCRSNNIGFGAGMTTNGLLINKAMVEVCKEFGLTGFQITLDGHKSQHDKVRFISEGRGSYDKIVQNIILLARNELRVNVRVNCSVETLNGINEILDDFTTLTEKERSNIRFDFHKVWQVTEDIEPELDRARAFFKENGFSVISGAHDTVVNSCYGDKRYQATLNYNGEVFKCTARDFKNNSGEGFLKSDGSIDWNEKYELRLNSKFNNAPCKECRILPICGGGCTQQALENAGTDYCVYNFNEELKVKKVIDKFVSVLADVNLDLSAIE